MTGACLRSIAFVLIANPGASSPPAAGQGVVVERALPGFEAAKAGIRPGDVLLSWERGPNPPANPAPAKGAFRSPFDLLEVYLEQAPRARTLTLVIQRAGARITIPILQRRWGLETRPRFSPPQLVRYEEGRTLTERGEIEKGWSLWQSFARDLSGTGSRVDAAWLWSRVAKDQSRANQPDLALSSLDRALAETRKAARPDIEAQLWSSSVDVALAAHRNAEARQAARQALEIRERIAPESLAVAHSLNLLPTDTEDPEFEARQRRTLGITEKLAPGSALEASSLLELAAFLAHHGDERSGLDLELRALAILRRLDPGGEDVGYALSNLCATQAARGELASAEEYCRQALELFRGREPSGDAGTAISLHNVAYTAGLRGDLDRAREVYLQALAIRERIAPVSRGVAWNLHELGHVELRRGNLDKAEEYLRRAEEIHRAVAQPYSPYPAQTAVSLAEIAYRRGNLEAAEKLLRDAVAFYDRFSPDGPRGAAALDDLGWVLAERGRWKEGEERLRRALLLRQKFAPSSRDTAESRHNLGMLLWRTGRLAEAETALRGAIDDLEAQRVKLGGSEEAWSVFSAGFADYYKDYLDLLMELGRPEDSFLVLERFRAAAFLRGLAQRDLAAPEEIPPELDRERRLLGAEYERTQSAIRELHPKDDGKKIEEALIRLAELRHRQVEVSERIRKASPRYATLHYPQPRDLKAARAALDSGTLLLSYAVGREKSVLFVVASHSDRGPPLSAFTLPVGEKALRESGEAFRRLIEWKGMPREVLARSRSLYEALLKPAEALIARSDRLLILADGPLHKLPWAALVRSVKSGQPEYLVASKPIHTAASATVYAELRKSRRNGGSVPAIQLKALGDPQYPSAAAPKVAGTRGTSTEDPDEDLYGDLEVRAVFRGGHRFEPLPRSRQEVEAITALFAPRAEAYLGVEATEERARSIGKGVPLIHYACHAYINERFPLDSALVLTIPKSPGPGQDNGLLQAWEIFEGVRIDADLVTLSACDSGLGKEMGGEGLIGLTRAFLYAGARSVLASLWKVEDGSTATLMKHFYGYLKAGHTKDESLRLAQLEMIRSSNLSHPGDWAAFELIGDWK
jgi:CHAT domain-containing protein/Flp pilus assembly protein TadD